MRTPVLALIALISVTAGLNVAHAGILEPTATLPPPTGIYTMPTTCIAPVCLENISFSDFVINSDVLNAGNEDVDTNAFFRADVFQNSGGSPGAFLGSLTISGFADFIYFGRSLTVPLGTFDAQITDFDFAGGFNGHTFEIKQNTDPSKNSLGQTTINQTPDGQYQVDSFFDIFAELSLDGGTFVPGPERNTDLTGAPEPGTAGMAGLGLLLGLAGWTSRRKQAR